MPYYLLLTRETSTAPFTIAFGDRDRATVKYERDDYRREYKASNLAIVAARSSRNAHCLAAVATHNAKIAAKTNSLTDRSVNEPSLS